MSLFHATLKPAYRTCFSMRHGLQALRPQFTPLSTQQFYKHYHQSMKSRSILLDRGLLPASHIQLRLKPSSTKDMITCLRLRPQSNSYSTASSTHQPSDDSIFGRLSRVVSFSFYAGLVLGGIGLLVSTNCLRDIYLFT